MHWGTQARLNYDTDEEIITINNLMHQSQYVQQIHNNSEIVGNNYYGIATDIVKHIHNYYTRHTTTGKLTYLLYRSNSRQLTSIEARDTEWVRLNFGYNVPTEINNTEQFNIRFNWIKRNHSTILPTLPIAFGDHTTPVLCTNLETALKTNKSYYLKCYLNPTKHSLLVFTNAAPNDVNLTKLFTMLPLAFTEFDTPENRKLAESVYNNDTATMVNILQNDYVTVKAQADVVLFEKFEENYNVVNDRTVALLAERCERYQRDIDNLIERTEQAQTTLRDLQMQKLGYETSKKELDPSIKTFLQNNKNIKLLSSNNRGFKVCVTTPVFNYVMSDVTMYYTGRRTSVFTRHENIGYVINETFIKQKYKLICTTVIEVPWDPGRHYYECRRTPTYDSYPNPHMYHHNCFRSTQLAVNQAIRNNNLILAFNMLIAAVGQLTFTDGIVMGELADDLYNSFYEIKCFEDENGILHSAKEIWEEHVKELTNENTENDG